MLEGGCLARGKRFSAFPYKYYFLHTSSLDNHGGQDNCIKASNSCFMQDKRDSDLADKNSVASVPVISAEDIT